MSPNKLPALDDAMLDLLWRQWHELGAPAARRKPSAAGSIIDPEALTLCSLAMLEREPRLGDALVSWCTTNSQFLSVQRMNNLARDYPESVRVHLPELARVIVESGKDLRWRALAATAQATSTGLTQRTPKRSVPAPLDRPAAFMLRMRAIFGLGLRADIIVFLLSKRDARDFADAGEVARALGYNRTAIKRTLDVLAAADAVNATTDEGDPGYSIAWTHFYERLAKDIDRLPRWRFAHQTFLWVIALLENKDDLAKGSEFLRELLVGRLLRKHTTFLTSEARLLSPPELRRAASLDTAIARTTRWLGAF